MLIHTKTDNESISDIAKRFGISEENLRKTNEIGDFETAIGEEMLILQPTREYKVQFGDTVDKIAFRFDLRKKDIYQNNPWLASCQPKVGETLTLKAANKIYGMSAANGYFFNGCTSEQLNRSLPFLTYVTFASANMTDSKISRVFEDDKIISTVNNAGKLPLVRIYDKSSGHRAEEKSWHNVAESMIEFATKGGYRGIVFSAIPYNACPKAFLNFLMKLRKLMIGCDLILITEVNDDSPIEFSEFADGSIMYYPKFAQKNPPSFDDGERRILSDFACRGESAKCFVDIPSLCKSSVGYSSIGECIGRARRYGYSIKNNEKTLLSQICDKKQGEICYTSLKNIKSVLDIINEMGYMGVCFDIMRTPLSHYMMYNSLFKTSNHINVRSREGCSRANEE